MKKMYFDTHKDLCDYMVYKAQDGIYTVSVLFYEDAKKLLRELMKFDDINVDFIQLSPEEWDGYDKEYYVSMSGDMNACVEQAYARDRYLYADADLTLIHGDASSNILHIMDTDKCREIYIAEEDEDATEHCCCESCKGNFDTPLDVLIDKAGFEEDEKGKISKLIFDIKDFREFLSSI